MLLAHMGEEPGGSVGRALGWGSEGFRFPHQAIKGHQRPGSFSALYSRGF